MKSCSGAACHSGTDGRLAQFHQDRGKSSSSTTTRDAATYRGKTALAVNGFEQSRKINFKGKIGDSNISLISNGF
ncbi:unnamed protein product [Protopolystoma xenopodis]|uniref:Uncharacterized protein n=1 Tax=Protopolystoma xenopodis TaxID=117903 RepID=A0A3S5BAX0_9PLAT|nr:unnamed protein product [Protopolystoma xenopodis]